MAAPANAPTANANSTDPACDPLFDMTLRLSR
jgi:hypothetical protein